MDGLDEIVRAARARAGLAHATCHELRHTCLTRLREAGMALEAVQAQAGHRSIESTRIYLHLANDWLAGEYLRAVEAIDATDPRGGDPMTAARLAVDDSRPVRHPGLGADRRAGTAAGGHGVALPRSDRVVVAARRRRSPPTSPCAASPATSPTDGVDAASRRSSAATSRASSAGSPPAGTRTGRPPARNTIRQRLGMVRSVLRPDHRVGLARRPDPHPDVRHRRARRR